MLVEVRSYRGMGEAVMKSKLLLIGWITGWVLCAAPVCADITNICTSMSEGFVVIEYDLTPDTPMGTKVCFKVDVDGREYQQDQLTLKGDVGICEVPGTRKKIVWNLKKDFPNCKNVRVVAKD